MSNDTLFYFREPLRSKYYNLVSNKGPFLTTTILRHVIKYKKYQKVAYLGTGTPCLTVLYFIVLNDVPFFTN